MPAADHQPGSSGHTLLAGATALSVNITVVQIHTYCGSTPIGVSFAAIVSGGQPTFSYRWTPGDGSKVSNGSSMFHSYVNAGNYLVGLQVSDSRGDAGAATYALQLNRPHCPANTSSPNPPSAGPPTTPWLAVLVGTSAVAGAAVATSLFLRRRSGKVVEPYR
jgi:PKD domain-containing protein